MVTAALTNQAPENNLQDATATASIRTLLADLMLSNTTETITVTDGDLDHEHGPRIQFVNIVTESKWGHAKGSLIGQRITCLWKQTEHAAALAQLRDVARQHRTCINEVETTTASGKSLWLQVSTTPMYDAAGKLKNLVRIGRDITERKNSDIYRDSTQRLLASVFGVINQALAVIDESGNMLMANTAVTRRLGWSIFDLIGKPFTRLLGEADGPRVLAMMKSGEALDQTRHLGCQLQIKGKPALDGEIELTTVLQADGRHCHVLVLRPAEAQAAKAQWDLEMAMRDALQTDKDKPQLVAGKLQLVGLQEIREQLGDKWAEIADKAYSTAERTIEKHMRPGDIFRRSTDDGYLVLFANLSETEAQFKARAIADEIRERLVGADPALLDARVSSVAKQVPVAEHVGQPEETILAAIERRLKDERDRVREDAAQRMDAGLRSEKAVLLNATNGRNEASPINFMRLPKDLRAATDSLIALGEVQYELESETFLLAGAAQHLLAGLGDAVTELLVTPVRINTLTRPKSAAAWLAVARALGDPCKRHVVAEIRGVPRDIASSLLADLVMRLSPLFKSVAIELPGPDLNFIQRLPSQVRLLTMAARSVPMGADKKPTTIYARVGKVLDVHQRRLILRNPQSPAHMLSLAAGAGTLFIREGN